MRTLRANKPDLLAGAILLGAGLFFAITGRNLAMGSAASMGPGYLPMALAIFLIATGGLLIGRGFFVKPENIDFESFWPLIVTVASLCVFAVFIDWLGLPLAVLGAIVVAESPFLRKHPVETLVLAGAASVLLTILFIPILGLSMKVLPG